MPGAGRVWGFVARRGFGGCASYGEFAERTEYTQLAGRTHYADFPDCAELANRTDLAKLADVSDAAKRAYLASYLAALDAPDVEHAGLRACCADLRSVSADGDHPGGRR
jgi:hypothetical protein